MILKKSKLVFVVMLREPLSRMQSAWYGLRHPPISKGRANFSTDVEVTVDFLKNSSGHSMLDWMWRSVYAPAISEYLVHFLPTQFVVIPMKQYTDNNTKVTDVVLNKLGASRSNVTASEEDWVSPGGETNRKNQGEHPSLDEDIDPEVRAAFDQEMKPYNDQLVKLLAQMYNEGSSLIGMDKEKPSEDDIRDWLYQNW